MFFIILILSSFFTLILNSTEEHELVNGTSLYELRVNNGSQYSFKIKAKQHQTLKMEIKTDSTYSPFNNNISIYEKDENDNFVKIENKLNLTNREIDGLHYVDGNYLVQYNNTDSVFFNFTGNTTAIIYIGFDIGGQTFDLINGTKAKYEYLEASYPHYFFIKAKEGNYFKATLSFTTKEDYNSNYFEYHYYLYEKRGDKDNNDSISIEPNKLIKEGTNNYKLIFYRKVFPDKNIDINYISFTFYFALNIKNFEIKIEVFNYNIEEEENEQEYDKEENKKSDDDSSSSSSSSLIVVLVIVFIFCIIIAVIIIYLIRRKKSLKNSEFLENKNPAPLMTECYYPKPIENEVVHNVTPRH